MFDHDDRNFTEYVIQVTNEMMIFSRIMLRYFSTLIFVLCHVIKSERLNSFSVHAWMRFLTLLMIDIDLLLESYKR